MDSHSQGHGHGHGRGRKPPPPRIAAAEPEEETPQAQDHWRVNIAEKWELAFWSKEFGCSQAQLRDAVAHAGDVARDVRAYLQHRHDN